MNRDLVHLQSLIQNHILQSMFQLQRMSLFRLPLHGHPILAKNIGLIRLRNLFFIIHSFFCLACTLQRGWQRATLRRMETTMIDKGKKWKQRIYYSISKFKQIANNKRYASFFLIRQLKQMIRKIKFLF